MQARRILTCLWRHKDFHRLACNIEDAGWELKDTLCWLYGEGFPKHKGSLKPAWEPIILAQKPRRGSYDNNILKFGCGVLNREECRTNSGRLPANLLLDEHAARLLDAQRGVTRSSRSSCSNASSNVGNGKTLNPFRKRMEGLAGYDDAGGASRFFYVPKANGQERRDNNHPTLKPVEMCEYLARLIRPEESRTQRRLLVPFSGVASEMLGGLNAGWDHVTGIEQDESYVANAKKRLLENQQKAVVSISSKVEKSAAKKPADLIEPNTVTCGNCVDLIPRLPDQSVQLVVTSPPYGTQRDGLYPGIPDAEYHEFTLSWMSELIPKLTSDASVLIVIRPDLKKGVIKDYVLRSRLALRDAGWSECEEMIWLKPDGGIGMGSVKRPRRTWESIHWFSRTHDPYIDTKACGRQSDDLLLRWSGRFDEQAPVQAKPKKRSGVAKVIDVIDVPVGKTPKGVNHPAMFPPALAEHLIRTFCPENGTVLDPFCGSGNTLIAAKNCGHNYVGFDIMEKYCELARTRLAKNSKLVMAG